MNITPRPCAECPFVLNRTQGFTGPYKSGDELHAIAASEDKFPCHKTMNAPKPPRCRGIDLYRDGICKKPRDPKEAAMQEATVRALEGSETAVPPFSLGTYHALKTGEQ